MSDQLNPIVFGGNGNFLITFIASFLIWLMFAFLFALWLFHHKFNSRNIFYLIVVSFVSWTVSEIAKYIFHTVRPFAVNDLVPLTLTIPSGFAFPSTHTALAFSLSSGVFKKDYKIGLIYFLLSGIVGFGRIASHVHYFIDIVGGAFIGLTTYYFLEKLPFSKRFLQ